MACRKLCVSTNVLLLLFFISCFTRETNCLYEDQAGKFDWRKSLVGKVKYADFDGNKLIVSTEENVLACLNSKTGDIIWRQVMENEIEQQTQLFDVNREITTVSGGKNNWYIRSWEINSGILLREWILNSEKIFTSSYWSISNRELIHVGPIEGSHIEVTLYNLESGQVNGHTNKISTPWLSDVLKCVTSKNYFICLVKEENEDKIKYVNLLTTPNEILTKSIDFPGSLEADILSFEHDIPSVVIIKNNLAKIVHLKNEVEVSASSFLPNILAIKHNDVNYLYQLDINVNNPAKLLSIRRQDANGDNDLSVDIEYPKGLGAPYILAGQCKMNNCHLLLTTTDHALVLVRLPEGKIIWTREEALSDIVAVEYFELPVSELDASIENEFKTSSEDILSMFIHRISTQTKQLSNLFFGSQMLMNNILVRDDFGLHKIIVVVTRVGKLFAIDTLSGHIVWSYRLPHIVPFSDGNYEDVLLFVQRTARYSPLPAQCTLLAKDGLTGNTILFQFDPISGLSSQGIVQVEGKLKQAMLLSYEDSNHLRPFLTVNQDDTVEIHPKSAQNIVEKNIHSIYFYMIGQNAISGYSLKTTSGKLKSSLHWNFLLGSSKLVAMSTRPSNERVHSQGRVLPDRSVYYKYVNPNLIALATITDDPVHKQVLSVYIIDGITGLVVYSVAHKKARGPVNLVHSENWVVYTFFNERYRRTELAALELYEGHIQGNSTVFSSYAMSQLPQVQAQSYIIPATPLKVTVTLTERGITSKCLLVALNSGAVVEIPWAVIQPRFSDIPCGPEESCYPYMPEIALHPEAIINYNQTLSKVRGISVAPARLESTSHILIHGLDMFYTRVAPSKTFDVLKEDFDYKLIILVLIGLIMASYITKSLASRKAIKQAWK